MAENLSPAIFDQLFNTFFNTYGDLYLAGQAYTPEQHAQAQVASTEWKKFINQLSEEDQRKFAQRMAERGMSLKEKATEDEIKVLKAKGEAAAERDLAKGLAREQEIAAKGREARETMQLSARLKAEAKQPPPTDPSVISIFNKRVADLTNDPTLPKRVFDSEIAVLEKYADDVPGGHFQVSALQSARANAVEKSASEAITKLSDPSPDAISYLRESAEAKGRVTQDDIAVAIQKSRSVRELAKVEATGAKLTQSGILGSLTGGNQVAESQKILNLAREQAASGKNVDSLLKAAEAAFTTGSKRGTLAKAGVGGIAAALLLPLLFGGQEKEEQLPLAAQMQLMQALASQQNQQALTDSLVQQRGADAELARSRAMMLQLQALSAQGGPAGGYL